MTALWSFRRLIKAMCVVAWDRTDYLLEAEKQLNNNSTCKSIEFKENFLEGLVENSNKMLLGLKVKG